MHNFRTFLAAIGCFVALTVSGCGAPSDSSDFENDVDNVALTSGKRASSRPTQGVKPIKITPCATVKCSSGYHCVASADGTASCVANPPTNTCANVRCIAGTHCEDSATGPSCIPNITCQTARCANGYHCEEVGYSAGCFLNGTCQTDAACRLADDYCGGCNCAALGINEELRTCTDEVQCLVQPCANKTAACVNNACVASDGLLGTE